MRTKLNLFAGAPTREHVKRIFWADLKALAGNAIADKSETELWLKLHSGSTLYCVGFDRPERFDGTVWHGGIVDEYADMKPEVWLEHIYPALMDTKGWAWLVGVPDGRNHYYELVQQTKESKDPDWKDYCWLSSDVLDATEIEKARALYDERTFRQELEGSFESYEGRAFVYYDASVHRRSVSFDPNHPLWIACDFNLDPCIWVIGQTVRGNIVCLEEIKQRQTDIWKMCAALRERIGQLGAKHVLFYGDYQHGTGRSVSAVSSSWGILRDEFPGAEFRIRPNPRIVDGVNAVNAKLRNARGEVSFAVDPKCVEIHKDFEQCGMQDILDRTEGKDRGHASSCLRYMVSYEFPVVRQTGWRIS